MKTVLCYGDSNTYGQVPLPQFNKQRFPFETRWTGRLQLLSADRYRIIEEGLNGRTTGLDDPAREGRSGRAYLPGCLDSHAPLDLVVLMLGTNDLKRKFDPSVEAITARMGELVRLTKILAPPPTEILLMAPLIPLEKTLYDDLNYEGMTAIARGLVASYERLAREQGLHFLDASKHLEASPADGCHLDAAVHERFAPVVLAKIDQIL